MRDIILYFAHKYFGDWERIYDAIEEQEDVDFELLEEIKDEYEGMYVTVLDDDYPKELKLIQRPPFVLFFKGNKELFYKKSKIWYYGNYYNDEFDEVAKIHKQECEQSDIVLVSGYTNEFERRYINSTGPKGMIIVRDSGINSYINMTRVEETHLIENNLLVSEYPDKVIPSLYTWEMSARIKTGLCGSMLLLNSLKERITFKLIADSIDEGRDIYCYEKEVDNKSHNTILISKGAYAINSIYKMKGKK